MMDTIWAPWRMEYIEANKNQARGEECVFCSSIRHSDNEESLVVHLGKTAAVILNRYPYNNGHLMVMPKRHVAKLNEINNEEVLEIFHLLRKSLEALAAAMNPDGFNLGLNLGKTAGAGIEDHIHIHIVPRWQGDTNFMPVLAETKVMPDHIIRTFRNIREAFSKIMAEK